MTAFRPTWPAVTVTNRSHSGPMALSIRRPLPETISNAPLRMEWAGPK